VFRLWDLGRDMLNRSGLVATMDKVRDNMDTGQGTKREGRRG